MLPKFSFNDKQLNDGSLVILQYLNELFDFVISELKPKTLNMFNFNVYQISLEIWLEIKFWIKQQLQFYN